MTKVEKEVYVNTREVCEPGSCFSVIQLHDRTEQEKRIEEETPFDELLSRLLAIPLSAG